MPFTLPQFNCLYTSWRLDLATGHWNKVNIASMCQWYVNPRVVFILEITGALENNPVHFLRVPKGTDLEEGDIIEVAPGDHFNYEIIETERVHLNFPNEYWLGFAVNVDEDDLPFGPLETETDLIHITTETLVDIVTENT